MQSIIEQNKHAVRRFNAEVIGLGNTHSFKELVADDVKNHAAAPGAPNGPESMRHFLMDVLRVGFPDLKVEILDQVAEGDKVTTRKVIHATHLGPFMGIPASNKKVAIHVIDIIRLRNGQYAEHWGMSNLAEIIAQLSA